jgi:hypothetical protein
MTQPESSSVDHPSHYGGKDNPYEAIRVIEAWGLGFCLGNALKYIARAGKKSVPGASAREAGIEDLRKAAWYLNRAIENAIKNGGVESDKT